jgi:hypothetical protein
MVTRRTEGWPAGLYLAAMIAKDSPDCLGTITGDDRYVADYLYRECLTRLPEEVQWFLCSTAVLGRLCGPLCDAALGSSGGVGGVASTASVKHVHRSPRSKTTVVPLPCLVPGVPVRRASSSSFRCRRRQAALESG